MDYETSPIIGLAFDRRSIAALLTKVLPTLLPSLQYAGQIDHVVLGMETLISCANVHNVCILDKRLRPQSDEPDRGTPKSSGPRSSLFGEMTLHRGTSLA
jgi:hypothetical protein